MSEKIVGEVQPQSYMANTRSGYGFVLFDRFGKPTCSITFADQDEASKAREALVTLLASAVDIA
ncbi:hypothetical protein [Reyranella sp.]|jgi:hypothetical protein|uniref:hypothetical protein n=1 Tax=Reyranella sp. TaxID=1929291 RepID=UPI000BC8FD46|nr:hypothetical protein [Reyranella sp.]OYY32963.1 MAG: hypothetical protein B7Y57_29915 [Rhodospirillales bacterium 35-66-84]OYZ90425.1 MAG: hypothetical protein B7Y08_29915 [Rhodospirillales bacterium 24-66-33]OZB20786.1 MAG: hypothetical protein B7X63_29910 [Rhodospirillales bacterium 39-66-50]